MNSGFSNRCHPAFRDQVDVSLWRGENRRLESIGAPVAPLRPTNVWMYLTHVASACASTFCNRRD